MTVCIRKLSFLLIAATVIALSAFPAVAQEEATGTDDMNSGLFPPQAAAQAPEYELPPGVDTHPMVRLTPDKSEIINLDTDVKSLIIGNPLHLNVIMDTTRRLVLVPRTPGATSFTALDENGQVVMQRHVIVNGPEEKYVRIRRSCDAARISGQSATNCQPVSFFYCPQSLCHNIELVTAAKSVSASGNKVVAPAYPGSSGGTGNSGGIGKQDVGTLNENFNENEGGAANPFVELLMKALQNSAKAQDEQPAE